MSEPRTFRAFIVAAGRGERAGNTGDGPKQYRRIGGKPVLAHAIAAFLGHSRLDGITVVIHPDDRALYETAIAGLESAVPVEAVPGGPTRQASCRAGLEAAAESRASRYALIHDAARPFLDRATIDGVLAALDSGAVAVLPAVAVADTLKRVDADGFVADTVPRAGLFAAQTPQGFDFAAILAAHRAAAAAGLSDFTDDCAVAEWAGHRVARSAGSAGNVKLTTAEDIAMAEERLRAAQVPDIRTGNGYDVHRLVPGDHVTLCGIDIPHTMRLDGHSDADVALHALTDALLATCAAGDIGDHFPPSDPQWRGMASSVFLAHAARIVAEAGGTILNVDVTLIAEAPKIGPHRLAMRRNLSEILGVGIDRCSVKATTNERLGFTGRSEGIAAIATASVAY
jgi:2-C-methyl-D-erythritol 2,4-cyclodiphosphate synthase/2-C-methyl-D-erythritol 4-phosphate cytidylyltransferase